MNNKAIGFLLSALFLVITFTIILLQLDVRTKNQVSIESQPSPVHSNSAQQLMSEGKYSQATNVLQHHYERYSNNPAFIELYAKSLILNGNLNGAIQTLESSLTKFPHNDNIRFELAEAQYLSQNPSKAYEILNRNNQNMSLKYHRLKALSAPSPEAATLYLKQIKNQRPLKGLFSEQSLSLSPNQSLIKSFLK